MAKYISKLAWIALLLAGIFSQPAVAQYEYDTQFGSFGSAAGQFDEPRGVAVNSDGLIIITESGNARYQVCTDRGACSAYGGPGVLSGEFDKPRGVAVNASDRIFIADRGNDRIQSCNDMGSCDDFDGREGSLGAFESPRGVAIDARGQVIIADTENHRIQICNDTGTSCDGFGSLGSTPGRFNSPSGVAVDSRGRIIVADRGNHRIQVCSATGNCSAFGQRGSALGQFDTPSQVAVDNADRIVVVDRFNDRVQVCDDAGTCIAFGSTGQGDGQFDLPWGVAVDGNNRIVVADLGNNRIQRFVRNVPEVSIDSFTATPMTIEAGESVTLSWRVSNADRCEALSGTTAWRNTNPNPVQGQVSLPVDQGGNVIFTLRCTGEAGSKSASVTVMVTASPDFLINPGLNDAWFNSLTSGQGFFFNVFPDTGIFFMAWFTYDVQRPGEGVTAVVGEPGHRWITAQGPFNGNTATLNATLTSGGLFDDPTSVTNDSYGTVTITFSDCDNAELEYDFPEAGVSGVVPVTRVVKDNVALCETLGSP
mgnify:CR=1 FL=1